MSDRISEGRRLLDAIETARTVAEEEEAHVELEERQDDEYELLLDIAEAARGVVHDFDIVSGPIVGALAAYLEEE